ncbi:MAG: hypothetical protein U1E87_02120 [Alphaproteobacteria bacterium]
MSVWAPACLALSAVLNIVFFHLLRAPTKDGRKLMDEIEGFRMYLSVAEVHRLNLLNPPEKRRTCSRPHTPLSRSPSMSRTNGTTVSRACLPRGRGAPGRSHYGRAGTPGPRLSRLETRLCRRARRRARKRNGIRDGADQLGHERRLLGWRRGGGGGGGKKSYPRPLPRM